MIVRSPFLNSSRSYANPHAPTSISGTTLTYDNSGNLTAYGTTTYAYDYRNRLTQAVLAGATTTYAYDHEVNRTRQTIASTTTWYPNKFFSRTATTTSATASATTTAYIYVGDTLVATIDRIFTRGTVTATTTRYIHPDHLGSTNVVTNASGSVVQTLDYYPYGSVRVNNQVNSANSAKQFIGEFTDQNSLNYLNSRFYDNSRGQFLNEDPTFLGNPKDQNLENPQSLNSYSYANGNPLTNKDPSGRQAVIASPVVILAGLAVIATYYTLLPQNQQQQFINAISQIIQAISSSFVNIGRTPTPANTPSTKVNTGTSAGTGSGVTTVPLNPGNTAPQQGILQSESGSRSTPRPNDAPSGTKPIDNVGLPRDVIHEVKEGVGAGPKDWTGVAPNGDVITGTLEGEAINHGPIDDYTHRPTGLVK